MSVGTDLSLAIAGSARNCESLDCGAPESVQALWKQLA